MKSVCRYSFIWKAHECIGIVTAICKLTQNTWLCTCYFVNANFHRHIHTKYDHSIFRLIYWINFKWKCTWMLGDGNGNGEYFWLLFNRFEWILNYHEWSVYAMFHSNTFLIYHSFTSCLFGFFIFFFFCYPFTESSYVLFSNSNLYFVYIQFQLWVHRFRFQFREFRVVSQCCCCGNKRMWFWFGVPRTLFPFHCHCRKLRQAN